MTPEHSVQLIEQIGKLLKEGNQDFYGTQLRNFITS